MLPTAQAVAAEPDPRERARLLHEDQRRIGRHELEHPVRQWYPQGVAGLLQTSAWARALSAASEHYTTEEDIAETVRIRAERTSTMKSFPVERRFLLTAAGLRTIPPGLTAADVDAQHEQLLELAALGHVHIRLAPDQARHDHPEPFFLRGGAVFSEGPNGLYSPPGSIASFEGMFARLWETADPLTAELLTAL